jgi:hypothetical protein
VKDDLVHEEERKNEGQKSGCKDEERQSEGEERVKREVVYFSLEMMASVYCEVEAFPPKSPVMALPSAMVYTNKSNKHQDIPIDGSGSSQLTSKMAFSMLSACLNKFMCLYMTRCRPTSVDPFSELHPEHRTVHSGSPQHHQRTQQQGGRVGQSFSGDIRSGTVDGLENGSVLSDVTRWRQTETSNKTGAHVGQDVSVQVGHDHDGVSVRSRVLNNL